MVHAGFATAVDLVWPPMLDAVSAVAAGRRMSFTGHSLGAALRDARRLPVRGRGPRGLRALHVRLAARRQQPVPGPRALPRVEDRQRARPRHGPAGLRARDGLIYRHVGKLRYLNPTARSRASSRARSRR